MPVVKLNLSVDPAVAETLRERAKEEGKPLSRYLSDLIERDARRRRDEVAAIGYWELSQDTGAFAEAALPVAGEVWPEWEGPDAP